MGGKVDRPYLSPLGEPYQGMRPYSSVILLACLTGLVLGQEDDTEDKKGKPNVKGKCKNSGPKPKDSIFQPYTKPYKDNKCPCWWDLSRNNCACCEEGTNAMQCGWPKHKWCYKKSDKGCPGVCNNAYTLSGKGFPCHNDPNNFDCAGARRRVSSASRTNGTDRTARREAGARRRRTRSTARVCRETADT